MGAYYINGGNRIQGESRINGGKNAILPILASVVLNKGISIIHDCPAISDTYISIEILKAMGCKVNFDGHTIIVDSSSASNCSIPEKPVREMRSSIIFLGGVLGRFRQVEISYPGGCELGARPIDLHLKALRQMGTEIREEHGFIYGRAPQIIGTRINLDFPSVGATENIMLTAVLAQGETVISNAAKEPEIIDLQNFLNQMGAKIKGAGLDTIVIQGVKELHDVEYRVMPDRIVAGTLLVAAAITGGEIMLDNVVPEHMIPITAKLVETGCYVREWADKMYLKAPAAIKPVSIRTHPHPGFPDCFTGTYREIIFILLLKSSHHKLVPNKRLNFFKNLVNTPKTQQQTV